MEKAFKPQELEKRIYEKWEKSGAFSPKIDPKEKPFVVMMPLPNVTGELHVGHALMLSLQDILTRYHRMKGEPTLYLPGKDHAAIAAQNVVEKKLWEEEKKTRHDLGKEEFLKRMWEWMGKYGGVIEGQIRRLGISCDWTRKRFTMDEDYQKSVKEAFQRLYKKGLIYQGERLVNWCPRCGTTLSDLEVDHEEKSGFLWYIRYPLADSKGQMANSKNRKTVSHKPLAISYITVATTRPETMLGDTAVAVSPKDKRYKDLIGRTATLPLMNREIPIVADGVIDPKFGTGALKVTPAHDPADFEIGERHKLPAISVIGFDDRITKEGGKYAGMEKWKARERVLEDLKKQGLLEKEESYQHSVGVCYRCKTTVEPLISSQWFIKTNQKSKIKNQKLREALGVKEASLGEMGILAVKRGLIKIVPKRFEKIYFHWMENIRDWCISRQIWWGHPIPVWYRKKLKIKNEKGKIEKRMGFHGRVVPQVFAGKTKTYRLRDHKFGVGDKVYFENSQTGEIFGFGKITAVKKTTVGEIDLEDPKHGATYERLDDLIIAFKKHHLDREVNAKTPVFTYIYEFTPMGSEMEVEREVYVGAELPKSGEWRQSSDTLDTWFSSSLWPFATLGWPHSAPTSPRLRGASRGKPSDLEYFYPGTVLETGYDILFFWVARMIMMGTELTGEVPFRYVVLNGLVKDVTGKKMSKTRPEYNIDPMDVVEKYGADALRMALVVGVSLGQDQILSEEKVLGYRNFANKVWNIGRFVHFAANTDSRGSRLNADLRGLKLAAEDVAILAELDQLVKKVTSDLDNFRFSTAGEAIYQFMWHRLADVYIEQIKERLRNGDRAAQDTLYTCVATCLSLLHPFMPYVTEAVWQELGGSEKGLLISSPWPKAG